MRIFLIFVLSLSFAPLLWAKSLVVSTQPIFLIAQEVTKDIEKPTLLLTPQETGHDVHLTPKAKQLAQDAELVIWIGAQHEAPLAKILNTQKNAVSLLDSPIVKILPMRDVKGQIINNSVDTHIWLEPNNAVRIAFFIAALRSQQHPEHKNQYWDNAKDFSKRMYDATKISLDSTQSRHYWAYHDAYQYLERALHLNFAGALSADHDLAPTAAQIRYLNQSRPAKQICLLAEYHVDQAMLSRLNPSKTMPVDETMSGEKDFVTAWLKLANAVQQCF